MTFPYTFGIRYLQPLFLGQRVDDSVRKITTNMNSNNQNQLVKQSGPLSMGDGGAPSRQLSDILRSGIQSLDLTAKQHQKAESEYEAITDHLSNLEWFCEKYAPDIFPQGSMDLGTCVRPIGAAEFDLDIVVVMAGLRRLGLDVMMDDLEKALSTYQGSHKAIKRMERCFRLDYPGDFHLDLVPARPDPMSSNPTAILLPSLDSEVGTPTDPRAFKVCFDEAKKRVLISMSSRVEKVINASVATVAPAPSRMTSDNKTVLQLLIQILKRHRDIHFYERKDGPSSAIIAALASASYLGHQDLYEAVWNALDRMHLFVNPVTPRVPNGGYLEEDYADRWGERPPDREAAFWEWYQKAQRDFMSLSEFKIANASRTLSPILGEQGVKEGLRSFDQNHVAMKRKHGTLGVVPVLGTLAGTSSGVKAAKQTSFFGN